MGPEAVGCLVEGEGETRGCRIVLSRVRVRPDAV